MKSVSLSNRETRMILSGERNYFKLPIAVDGAYRFKECKDNKGGTYFDFIFKKTVDGIHSDFFKAYYPPYQENEVIFVKDWGELVNFKVMGSCPDKDSMGNWNWLTLVEVLDYKGMDKWVDGMEEK